MKMGSVSTIGKLNKEGVIGAGFKEGDIYFSNGSTLLLECCGAWYQVLMNPITLMTEQRSIKTLGDVIEEKEYDTPRPRVSQPTPKSKPMGKALLPPYIVRKSEKWYFDTQSKKWIIAQKIQAMYIIPS